MNTRKYPRSLTEAFGPYARGPVQPMRDKSKTPAAYWCVYAIAVVVLVLLVAGVIR